MLFLNQFSNNKIYSEDIQHELDRELVAKSQSAVVGFFLMAAWVAFQQLGTVQYAKPIKILGFSLMLFSALRFWVNVLYNKGSIDLRQAAYFTKINILLNALLWSVTLILPIIEYKYENLLSAIEVIALVLAFSLSSMVSISYNLLIAFAFQWVIIMPTAVYLFFLFVASGNRAALNSAVILTIGIVYLFQQSRSVHAEVVRRIKYALDLENSNKLLSESQNLLIQEKAKLQHSIKLAAIGEISAEISHEINNPLAIIKGYIELSLELLKESPQVESKLESQLIKAKTAITRITKIIKSLNHYSRRTNDDPMVPIYINEIIEDALEFCSEKFNYNKTTIEIDSQNEYLLFCRPVEISQVLLNIFSNALDEVMKLASAERKIKILVLKKGDKITILISNSGPKIRIEIQDKLFEPFFSTKKVGIGTGLGLSISSGIIQSYNGKLYFDRSQEQTTFVIELPLYLPT